MQRKTCHNIKFRKELTFLLKVLKASRLRLISLKRLCSLPLLVSLVSIVLLTGCTARHVDVGYVQPVGYYSYYPTGYMTQDIVVVGP